MSSPIIPFPQEFRPTLPTIVGNVDYLTLRQRLEQIDSLLRAGGVERDFVERSLAGWRPARATALEQGKFQQRSRRALRCTILRTLLQEDYRGFSCQLAGNPLFQWFCQVDALDQVRVPSKSELQRFAHWLPIQEMRAVIDGLLQRALHQPAQLGLKEALDLEEYFLDSTCLKANLHFPTDWVLLRDGVRTLMKATVLIRRAGLRARMEEPETFLRRMNGLSIAMTQQARRAYGKKARKRVLRDIKQLVGTVRAHARRHRELLDQRWAETEWTRPQAEQILRRLDSVLELLPRAQEQAHERIIGGRPVPNAEKILSLYDLDLHVIVRGKAGAQVEFGNTLLIGENRQGVILHFKITPLFAGQNHPPLRRWIHISFGFVGKVDRDLQTRFCCHRRAVRRIGLCGSATRALDSSVDCSTHSRPARRAENLRAGFSTNVQQATAQAQNSFVIFLH